MGRPLTPFAECSESSIRRKTRDDRDQHSIEELAYATHLKLREEGHSAAAKFCARCTSSPEKAVDILINVSETKECAFSPVEALNNLVTADLSKSSYVFLRHTHREKGCSIYPSYEQVLCEKKN